MKISWVRQVCFAVVLATMAGGSAAQWQLNAEQSALYFASVKNDTVGEVHSFKKLQGSLAKDGRVEVLVDLASVDTLIPIRDSRMKELLFDTANFPQARISAAIDYQRFDKLSTGASLTLPLDVEISLHGQQQEVQTEVRVVKLSGQRLLVAGSRPILLNTGDFALSQGVEKLRAIVGLSSISPMVPVNISLVFERAAQAAGGSPVVSGGYW